jgi:hypothetical protein
MNNDSKIWLISLQLSFCLATCRDKQPGIICKHTQTRKGIMLLRMQAALPVDEGYSLARLCVSAVIMICIPDRPQALVGVRGSVQAWT